MICLGNICRSPLAEELLRTKLNDDFVVDSCGTSAYHEGKQPDKRSILVAQKKGIDISAQKSRPLSEEDYHHFDVLLCMDRSVLSTVLNRAPAGTDTAKIKLFLAEADMNDHQGEVPDPYYGDLTGFQDCYNLIDRATDTIAKKYIAATC